MPHTTANITSRKALYRIALDPDPVVGEAYMDRTLQILDGNIYGFMDLCLGNLRGQQRSRIRSVWQAVRRMARPLALHNPARRAERNVAQHYDLSDQLSELFLDADRQYSCAYYLNPDDTLEVAQA